jgi:hypothetical protein
MVFEGHVTLAFRAEKYPYFVSGGRGLRGHLSLSIFFCVILIISMKDAKTQTLHQAPV